MHNYCLQKNTTYFGPFDSFNYLRSIATGKNWKRKIRESQINIQRIRRPNLIDFLMEIRVEHV